MGNIRTGSKIYRLRYRKFCNNREIYLTLCEFALCATGNLCSKARVSDQEVSSVMASNGDTKRKFQVGSEQIEGVGSFHKTLPHNDYGEVKTNEFHALVAATEGSAAFAGVPPGPLHTPPILDEPAPVFANPQAGLAHDRLTHHPVWFDMPPAPTVLSVTTAAEMTEIYWMAVLRDLSFDAFSTDSSITTATTEISAKFQLAVQDTGDAGHLKTGVDVPGASGTLDPITQQNIFRLGLPGEEFGPLVSQFFVRDINYGTQSISQKQRPYTSNKNYLTSFDSWLQAQNSGNGDDGKPYPQANEKYAAYYEDKSNIRYISTMRDLARFVNKDALHQAYFNAALILLNGKAKWTPGNPYAGTLGAREAGFGTLGGPHILALVSEVATRALKIVWNQKWQVNLRLRPEAYGGLVHVQSVGVGGIKRAYGLPDWVSTTNAAVKVRAMNMECGDDTFLLPMAFTPGSPAHPSYGAGHATVAGACVTILKAFFKTFDKNPDETIALLKLSTLVERTDPYAPPTDFAAYITGVDSSGKGTMTHLPDDVTDTLTIEGELNKLAMNVAMGRTMGGVHWRTDNTRSLKLGEAIAAQILADISVDLAEKPAFTFRTFDRKTDGEPKIVEIKQGRITVDHVMVDSSSSSL
jgi:hypothetical protein